MGLSLIHIFKWDPAKEPEIIQTLISTTLAAGATHPDLILWPESTLPWALKGGDPSMKQFVERLASRAKAPMLIGADATERPEGKPVAWYNAAYVIDPQLGVQTAYYATVSYTHLGAGRAPRILKRSPIGSI